ncbi:MAG: hypothetical protein QJT81_10690 [Candidatus Thiothrix putei]|uniref:Fibronectin type-III domain-containing protein n=1 Tax=Candidatus Thiothrix putei TaxID=3080811 RepID=A0AA95HFP6_9GAMM|nr:MAG: hypothetical protein QJT81_10690 [Candidatus Thiothrix putei]
MNIASTHPKLYWLGLLLLTLTIFTPAANAEDPPSLVRNWGNGTPSNGDGNLQQPADVAVDSAGNVYVADKGNTRIQKFSKTGTFIKKWSTSPAPLRPTGIAIDENVVYVVEGPATPSSNGANSSKVQKFTLEGELLNPNALPPDVSPNHTTSQWGSSTLYNGADGQLFSPVGIEVAENFVFVVDDYNGKIQVFNKYTGQFLAKGDIGYYGIRANGIAVDANPSDGSQATVYTSINNIPGSGIWKYTFNEITTTTPPTYNLALMNAPFHPTVSPRGLTVDKDHNLYATLSAGSGNKITKMDGSSTIISSWGANGNGDGQLSSGESMGILTTDNGEVYVADEGNHRIQVFAYPILAAPTNLTATPTGNQVDLAWTDNSDNETGFSIERCAGNTYTCFGEAAPPFTEIHTTAPTPDVSTYSDSGLSPGTYTYRVRAVKDTVYSEYSAPAEATVAAAPALPAPTNLIATEIGSSKVAVTWQDNSTDEVGFELMRCTAQENCSAPALVSVSRRTGSGSTILYQNTNTATLPIAPNTTYYYKVRAYKGTTSNRLYSDYSSSANATTLPLPNAPVLIPPSTEPTSMLTSAALSGSKVILRWTDNSQDETLFRIYREECQGEVCGSNGSTFTAPANKTELLNGITPPKPDTVFNYRVSAERSLEKTVNGIKIKAVDSNFSSTVTLRTPALPTAPSNLVAQALSSTKLRFNWTDNSSDETGFRIERCTNAECSTFTLAGTTLSGITTKTISVSSPGTYRFRVRAYRDVSVIFNGKTSKITELSEPSGIVDVTTLAPPVLTATKSGNNVTLNWTYGRTDVPFFIERCTVSSTPFGDTCEAYSLVAAPVSGNTFTHAIPPTTVRYYYRVRPIGADFSTFDSSVPVPVS